MFTFPIAHFSSEAGGSAFPGLGSISYNQTYDPTDTMGMSSTTFKPDGTKAYVTDSTNAKLWQYSLSTAWDISTMSQDAGKTYTISEDTNPRDMKFNDDGTKMYVIEWDAIIYQYSLSTAYDISTASYDSVSLGVNGTSTRGHWWRADGLRFYVVSNGADTVYQYSCSSAWDLSTASYDSKSFYVYNEETYPSSCVFTSDGLKMLVGGLTTDDVFEYDLSTAWDVSTAVYNSVYLDSSTTLPGSVSGMFLGDGDTKLYISDQYTPDAIYQFD